jgi:hypothetical protein
MYEYIEGDKIVHSTLESGEDISVRDQWNREYHFKIASFPVQTGLASEAIEVKEDNTVGYVFNILSDYDIDPEFAKETLIRKIKRGLNRRHLKKRDGKWEIGKRQILRGRIEWNDNFTDTEYDRVFVIDGKRITIEEFGGMLEPWEGWHFQFNILDRADDDA